MGGRKGRIVPATSTNIWTPLSPFNGSLFAFRLCIEAERERSVTLASKHGNLLTRSQRCSLTSPQLALTPNLTTLILPLSLTTHPLVGAQHCRHQSSPWELPQPTKPTQKLDSDQLNAPKLWRVAVVPSHSGGDLFP